jgi:hypothetical protein
MGFTAGILPQKVLRCRTMRSPYHLSKRAHLICPRAQSWQKNDINRFLRNPADPRCDTLRDLLVCFDFLVGEGTCKLHHSVSSFWYCSLSYFLSCSAWEFAIYDKKQVKRTTPNYLIYRHSSPVELSLASFPFAFFRDDEEREVEAGRTLHGHNPAF